MWPFNRKKKQQQSAVATEVQNYYETEKRGRRSVAWLLAVVTFFVTLFVVLGLFYGGKWLYQKVTDDNTASNGTDTAQVKDESKATEEEVSVETTPDQNQPTEQNQDGQATSGQTPEDDPEVAADEDQPQTSSTRTTTPSTTTPVTGPSDEELPRTGPDQDL